MADKSISQLVQANSTEGTDLLEVAQVNSGSASGYVTRSESIDQISEYVGTRASFSDLETDDKNLVDAVNEVSANCVHWDDNSISGAKNFFLYPFFGHPKQGEVYNQRGIDFSDNGDGGIKANGVNDNTGNSYCQIHSRTSEKTEWLRLPKGKYFFTGGISEDYYMSFSWSTIADPTNRTNIGQDYGDGFEFEITEYMAQNYIFHAFAFVVKGKTADNVVFYPMIRLLDDNDANFKRYAQNNQFLTENKVEHRELATVETTGNASRAYTIGEYMTWRGELHKVTAAISAGGAITLNTNVTKTTIGDELKALFAALT